MVEDVENPTPEPTENLILDGQQRLTSLYQSLFSKTAVATKDGKGQPVSRWYYIDMRKALGTNGDMARIIYERFFLYAAELEKAFPTPDDASFQYILTTTTHPPKSMREGSRWLLLPVLNSLNKDTRLLGVDF